MVLKLGRFGQQITNNWKVSASMATEIHYEDLKANICPNVFKKSVV